MTFLFPAARALRIDTVMSESMRYLGKSTDCECNLDGSFVTWLSRLEPTYCWQKKIACDAVNTQSCHEKTIARDAVNAQSRYITVSKYMCSKGHIMEISPRLKWNNPKNMDGYNELSNEKVRRKNARGLRSTQGCTRQSPPRGR